MRRTLRVSRFRWTVAVISGDSAPLRFGRVVVIGGGCYGSWYAQQLTRAAARGAFTAREVIVVDRDADCRVATLARDGAYGALPLRVEICAWDDYLRQWLAEGPIALASDAMVPSPLMPHLCLNWLIERAKTRWPDRLVTVVPLTAPPPMPWERAAPDGRHYVSFATWTCPVNCIEPARCPATRGERDWSMPSALRAFAAEPRATLDVSLILHCTHRTYGVGMIDARDIVAGDALLHAWKSAAPFRLLVGTVSHCHGALGVLTIAQHDASPFGFTPA